MKRFALSVALLCALSVSALAVDVPTVGAPSPHQADSADTPAPGPNFVAAASPGEMPGIGLSALLTILDWAF